MSGKGNDIWNDPEWDALRRRINKRTSSDNPKMATVGPKQQKPVTEAPKSPAVPKKIEVSLNLTVPKIRLPKPPKFTSKQIKIGLACVGILTVSIFASVFIANRNKGSSTDGNDVLSDSAQEPEFETVLPEGKKEETTSGKLGYDPQRKVASFTDKIGTASITVSQQELPEAFKANPDEEVKKVAEGFSATEVINESNPKAYLGNDVAGPQTVIFHKKGLLVFILSDKQVDKDQWAEYITKLL